MQNSVPSPGLVRPGPLPKLRLLAKPFQGRMQQYSDAHIYLILSTDQTLLNLSNRLTSAAPCPQPSAYNPPVTTPAAPSGPPTPSPCSPHPPRRSGGQCDSRLNCVAVGGAPRPAPGPGWPHPDDVQRHRGLPRHRRQPVDTKVHNAQPSLTLLGVPYFPQQHYYGELKTCLC